MAPGTYAITYRRFRLRSQTLRGTSVLEHLSSNRDRMNERLVTGGWGSVAPGGTQMIQRLYYEYHLRAASIGRVSPGRTVSAY